MPYADCWELQKTLLARRVEAAKTGGDEPERLLLVEHPPVYTFGKRTRPEHLGPGPEALRALGAGVFEVERGGEVTFHGPGQIVGYPIVCLPKLSCGRDLHKYMRGLEETLILVLADLGLRGERLAGLTGVWVKRQDGILAKVAALGVRVRKWCAMHGFALNVTTDLRWFRHITPCGIGDRPVTRLEELLSVPPDSKAVEDLLARRFAEVFGLDSVAAA